MSLQCRVQFLACLIGGAVAIMGCGGGAKALTAADARGGDRDTTAVAGIDDARAAGVDRQTPDAPSAAAADAAADAADAATTPDATAGRGPALDGPPDRPTATTADAATASDATSSSGFPATLYDSVWMAGWSGGLEHFSWIKFMPGPSGLGGTWETIAVGCSVCAPYFAGCPGGNGKGGQFTATAPATLVLQLPATCAVGGTTGVETWTFERIGAPTATFTGSTATAFIRTSRTTGTSMMGYKYPPARCNPAFTTCQTPFPF